jgi:hypothetical protein
MLSESDSDKILNWIRKISTIRPELGGFSICPFASLSTNKIIKCSVDDIEPISGFDVIIFIVEDYLDVEELESWVEFYSKMYKKYDFFVDSYKNPNYIDEIQTSNDDYNLILCQPIEKLKKFRRKLAKTDYYSHWGEGYLQKILKNDLHIVKNKGKSG